jgi:hypothetical protein
MTGDLARERDGTEYDGEIGHGGAGHDEFAEEFGEPLSRALDLATWHSGVDMDELYLRLNEEYVAESLRFDREIRPLLRQHVFEMIRSAPHAPAEAGVYRATTSRRRR